MHPYKPSLFAAIEANADDPFQFSIVDIDEAPHSPGTIGRLRSKAGVLAVGILTWLTGGLLDYIGSAQSIRPISEVPSGNAGWHIAEL
ncbi:hypothetical protein C9412_18880 [Stenotrophomonas sp. Nf1]|nr:hypothetical protein C9412_18880 [Stenotrophomonas sp. Nf1]PTA76303.1 hypothetical protein C9416_18005 [Stenotrophomonas sp. Nf4]